jgi:hypothetical protein
MKIEIINQHLSQTLHLQFAVETESLVKKFNFIASKIAPQFTVFCTSAANEDLCFKIKQ